MIKVIGFKVRTHNAEYKPGDIISDMSPEDEAALIKDGYAEMVEGTGEKTPAKDPKGNGLNAEELIKLIEATETIEELEKILAEEQAGKNRKTVVAAAIEKLDSLEAAVNNDDDSNVNQEDAKGLVVNFDASDMVVTGAQ